MPTTNPPGVAIVLAAGFSRRFGRDKRLERLGSETLLQQVCKQYTNSFERVVVVLRDDDEAIADEIRSLYEVATTRDAIEGMSQSLRAGIQYSSEAPWAVIAHADMPFVKPTTLRLLHDELVQYSKRAIRLTYNGKFGNPTGIGSCWFPLLSKLEGDKGAKKLLESEVHEVTHLEVNDPGILIDLDTPQMFDRYKDLRQS